MLSSSIEEGEEEEGGGEGDLHEVSCSTSICADSH